MTAVPAFAQSVASGPEISVTARDGALDGLPASVPVGTVMRLVNEGTQVHELLIARRDDGVTESWDELLAMPEVEALARLTILGQVEASPGLSSEGTLVVDREGEYIALCFVPQASMDGSGPAAVDGTDPMATPEPERSPEPVRSLEPERSPEPAPTAMGDPAAMDGATETIDPLGPPHLALGVRQAFTVIAADTTPGPPASPAAPTRPSPAASPIGTADPGGRVIELTEDVMARILFDGQKVTELAVTPGETISFRVTNTAGFAHDLFIGTEQQLMAGEVATLPGVPRFSSGTRTFSWTVPTDIGGLRFGCTVPGHYQLMNGAFTLAQ